MANAFQRFFGGLGKAAGAVSGALSSKPKSREAWVQAAAKDYQRLLFLKERRLHMPYELGTYQRKIQLQPSLRKFWSDKVKYGTKDLQKYHQEWYRLLGKWRQSTPEDVRNAVYNIVGDKSIR